MIETYDGPLDIATGKSRRQINWKNKKVTWLELVKKLSVTHRTAETYKDYLTFKRDRQDEIKDIGGFVGGYLTGGKRRAGAVAHRQIITLDIDKGGVNTWENFLLVYGCAACVYTTHKHSSESPRYRLVIPLDREIFADEYEPICRRIAGNLGIEAFTDTTTYEATRLMYWPSTSKDGEFFSDHQAGPWLSADEVLATYRDWKDSSEWPICSTEKEKVRSDIKRQEDPLTKRGLIGAFCRTYSIVDAIDKYLSGVYEPTADPGRYTYVNGSTSGGLVIYDDKFAYSHHGSDPTGGILCNSFDLVRIHLFGLQDEGKKDKTASMSAIEKLISKDKEVKKQLGAERIESALEDFQPVAGLLPGEDLGEIDGEEEETDDEADALDWLKELDVDKKGNYTSSIDNIYKVLSNDKALKGRLYYDEFQGCLICRRSLPWRVVRPDSRDFTDDDEACLAHYLERYTIPFTHIEKGLAMVRNDNKVHPVRDYLHGLTWDGVDRLDRLFIDYLGAADNAYVKAATRKTFVAAVARVMEPGVKFDTVLTLLGAEGVGKSTIINKMAGKWFSDCLGDIHKTSGMESLRGCWIMEIAELSAFRRADQEAIKRFISSQEDIYRPAYGKRIVRHSRQCIFFATSNKLDFLAAGHKHRRFLPVEVDPELAVKDVFTELTPEVVGLIWAEALTYYEGGESLDLSNEIKVLADKVREQHTEVDERAGLIREYINLLLPGDWDERLIPARAHYIKNRTTNEFNQEEEPGTVERQTVCVPEIWCELFERRQSEMSSQNTKFIHDIMQKMKGWRKVKRMKRKGYYGPVMLYERV